MEPIATPGFVTDAINCSASEIQDFDAVVRLHWPRVFRYALASLRDREDAESLTQDCFLRAYKGRERFRGDSSVTTWLLQIAVNLVRDQARNRRLQFWKRTRDSENLDTASLRIPDRDLSPEGRALANEQLSAVWEAMEKLPERQRTVFLLRFVEDMDLLEIAAATGLREGTVKVHLFRALHSVRERIGRTV
jgi:RNA polymerase sigma-70 factor, ECF subfamily